MTKYETELQRLKDWDTVKSTHLVRGYDFITTAQHGYLVVPETDKNFNFARSLVGYGFGGRYAVYLEQDCEATAFLQKVAA